MRKILNKKEKEIKMVKNLFKYIFIYILLSGVVLANGCENNTLEIEASKLKKSWKGYYVLEWLDGYKQTFTTLDAHIGSNKNYSVKWEADKGIKYQNKYIDSVNHNSYSGNDGIAHTVFSAWGPMIGKVVTVSAVYKDECGNIHRDDIKIKVKADTWDFPSLPWSK